MQWFVSRRHRRQCSQGHEFATSSSQIIRDLENGTNEENLSVELAIFAAINHVNAERGSVVRMENVAVNLFNGHYKTCTRRPSPVIPGTRTKHFFSKAESRVSHLSC